MEFDYAPRPRHAKDGIKAASERGSFAESWWAKRWIAVLESFDIASRLQRGRSYARKGQVLSIEVQNGSVKALVQGSRAEPYRVQINIKPIPATGWKRLIDQLGTQAIFAAKLLSGEMPQNIEQAFSAAGLSLFPEQSSGLTTDCSCPDWSNPCKHVAAVYYLMGEAFDRDPFLIFRMRGMDREAFTRALGGQASAQATPPPPPEPLPPDPSEFWKVKPLPPDAIPIANSSQPAALPRRLGNLPFWRGDVPLTRAVEPIYTSASQHAERILLSD